jgi:hypothetical protein
VVVGVPAPEAAAVFGFGGSASAATFIRGLKSAKVGIGCATSASGATRDTSSGGSISSAVSPSARESVMVAGLPRAETAKSSSNSSP